MKKVIFATLALSASVVASAAGAPQVTDQNKPIVVKSGQNQFVIIVKSNPTTGFTWLLQNCDRDLVTPVSAKYIKMNSKLIGAPGYTEWTFKLNSAAFTVPTMTKVTLRYARAWELKSNQVVTYTVVTQ